MTDEETLPDWVLIEAGKRCGGTDKYGLHDLRLSYKATPTFRALCDMIWKYEPPVDPLVDVAESLGYFNTAAELWADDVRAALGARGLEIREKGQ